MRELCLARVSPLLESLRTLSAAQNGPVIQTCKQCGAINHAGAETCCFCAARLNTAADSAGIPIPERAIGASAGADSSAASSDASVSNATKSAPSKSAGTAVGNLTLEPDWREEVSDRVKSYRARRKHSNGGNADSQNDLPFETEINDLIEDGPPSPASLDEEQYDDPLQATLAAAAARMEMESGQSGAASANDEAAFTHADAFQPLLIDVSRPPESSADSEQEFFTADQERREPLLVPVADLTLRRRAGIVDVCCIFLAFAGVFGLFLAAGGQMPAAKSDWLVLGLIAGLLYAQYFTLFTMMGGATPGMMLAGLRLVNFDGSAPAPGQLMWRSFGYLISGGTAFLGFLWTLWDEDHLSWHDRMSQTYITSMDDVSEAAAPGSEKPVARISV
jgi:uncharacterized RDD family membrane protein YckC